MGEERECEEGVGGEREGEGEREREGGGGREESG